jgi:hypothetical protein
MALYDVGTFFSISHIPFTSLSSVGAPFSTAHVVRFAYLLLQTLRGSGVVVVGAGVVEVVGAGVVEVVGTGVVVVTNCTLSLPKHQPDDVLTVGQYSS